MTWRKKIKLPQIQRRQKSGLEGTPEKAPETPGAAPIDRAEFAQVFWASILDSLFEVQHSINDLETVIEAIEDNPRQLKNAKGNYDQLTSKRETMLSYVENTIMKL